ncbi:hypothetical protein FNL39_104120 [Nocardia caishijiensis]|uniref:Uncharacterized protein n=1 Tax=Nocardia caishijiensis TaxID=184756 RepID=A0ABQ6YLM5_9NOCA|nr:hypothetical protein FNL39_104120 [Nocardia caishijiensis]
MTIVGYFDSFAEDDTILRATATLAGCDAGAQ